MACRTMGIAYQSPYLRGKPAGLEASSEASRTSRGPLIAGPRRSLKLHPAPSD
jgi:hypothetical protein